jgi:ADP-ribosylation factor-like protein 8
LISKPQLANIPLLVLGTKNDLPDAIGVDELIARMFVVLNHFPHIVDTKLTLKIRPKKKNNRRRELNSITGREVCCYSISAKNNVNIDITLDWLIKHADSPRNE